MDTSKTRIKMCEKAEEIQRKWSPSDWDWVYCRNEGCVVVLSGYSTDGGYYGHETPSKKIDYYTGSCDDISQKDYKKYHIWLPHQNQLQEMAFSEDTGVQTITTALEQFSKSEIGSAISILGSMEQLWLAFVMKEKYDKVWDGSNWISGLPD